MPVPLTCKRPCNGPYFQRLGVLSGTLGLLLTFTPCAFSQAAFDDVNPSRSTLHAKDPDGASGGRTNGLASTPGDSGTFYAATEWGGIYKTTNRGRTWFRLDRHLANATWDVAVDPEQTNRVYATSFYDGRVTSQAGINVSTDGGATWTKPITATPPDGLCSNVRRIEPSAFGISIDPDDASNVYIGTNCGLAISNDRGATWRFLNPRPLVLANNIWDVVAHDGLIDLCGDDGHFRSTDGGTTWAAGAGLPAGRCSIAASPYEADVLFAAADLDAWESNDGGTTWTRLGTPDQRRKRQGRIPFVATNARSDSAFDLWYGDIRLYRGECTSNPVGGGLRCPMADTGPELADDDETLPLPAGWSGPFTRAVGGHDDVGDISFDAIKEDGNCPVLFSSDGGIYFNTNESPPDCHSPSWEQPRITPHALWTWSMDGADLLSSSIGESLYFGVQDNGSFAATNVTGGSSAWLNTHCCDVFDMVADPQRVVYTLCCPFSVRVAGVGMGWRQQISTDPPGVIPKFNFLDFIDSFGDNRYVAATRSGVYITNSITSDPVEWTTLGAATTPAGGFCAVQSGLSGGVPTFFALTICGRGQLWRYTGTDPGSAWQRVDNNDGLIGGFGIFAVDPRNPNRLYASNLDPAGPKMVFSRDGGNSWQNDEELDDLMTGGGEFRYATRRGPVAFTRFAGYPQPSLLAFDPENSNIIVAGGQDSGVFITTDGGVTWSLLTDPFDSGNSGTPHLPRPWFAYFDHKSADSVNIYVGTQGRGVWRIRYQLPRARYAYGYAAKVVCGAQPDADNTRLAAGTHATTVNIHNPGDSVVRFVKNLALTFPPTEQRPGEVTRIADDSLRSHEALKIDCLDIERRLFPNGFPESYIEGFVSMESTDHLDVTGVYTITSPDGASVSLDIEEVSERRFQQPPPPPVVHTSGTTQIGRDPPLMTGGVDFDGLWTMGFGTHASDLDIVPEDDDQNQWNPPHFGFVRAVNGARIHAVGTTSVGKNGCATAPLLESGSIHLRHLPVGTYVCVQTNMGRYAEFRVEEIHRGLAGLGYLTVLYTTWQAVP